MRKRLLINNHHDWVHTLNAKTDILHFQGMGDMHPFAGPVVEAETVVFERCNKNFAFYWANRRVLPTMKEVYMFSHPCEPSLLRSLGRQCTTIYLVCFWERYAQWVPELIENEKLRILSMEEHDEFLSSIETCDRN